MLLIIELLSFLWRDAIYVSEKAVNGEKNVFEDGKNKGKNYNYEFVQIFENESYTETFLPFMQKAKSQTHRPNQYVSVLTQNQYITLAKTFIKLYPREEFPLRISKQALTASHIRGMKNIYLRKFSPLAEPLSVAILRIFQSGICQYFRIIQTSTDFSINPNIRTAEKDWSQIITLELIKTFFIAMLILYLIGTVIGVTEKYSTKLVMWIFKSNLKNSRHLNFQHLAKVKSKSRIISIVGFFLTGVCFTLLAPLYPQQTSFGE